jgi:choice-of-anchor B domain-containing protein
MTFKRFLYLSVASALLPICATSQNLNVTFKSHLTYPGHTCANICGYVDSLGNEYALVGVSTGMSVVDVTDPANPTEVIQIPGPDNEWKEIKVRGKYAYVTTEGGGGLQIVNLSSLPNTAGIVYHNWTGDGAISGQLNSIHALHIDSNFVYLYGSNLFSGGAVVADITDRWNPTYVGKYQVGAGNSAYVHDGYVRHDTLYAGHIYSGYFSVVDFTDKANPVELANQFTPSNFTHNTWLSRDSKTLFTTDEVNNSFLTAYDISDLANINELDRIQSNPGSNSIVHNVHIINVAGNDYAVTSWYKDGFTIVDAGRPENLVQVGNYDTDPTESGADYGGAWGVYPFLPSGTIVVSNINDGLYVFTPTYVRASYLEGIVTDSITGQPINNATIEILTASVSDYSKITGAYATGTPAPGIYNVKYSKPGYFPKIITGVSLLSGQITNQNVALAPKSTFVFNGLVNKTGTSTAVANAAITITSNDFIFNATADANGNFTFPAIYDDTYLVTAGKWGYITKCTPNQAISSTSGTLTIELDKGYYDDFTFNFGWTTATTAATGAWVRDLPLGTDYNGDPANPSVDDATDCGDMAYVTGNTGTTSSDDDIDNGATTLSSPVFDLTGYSTPYLDYTRWFYNGGGSGVPNDSLNIYVTNGTQTQLVEYVIASTPNNSTWVHKSFKIADYITPTATMKVIVKAGDTNPGHIVEGGFDKCKSIFTCISKSIYRCNYY